ncbi:aminotransferase class I/II-fold pyridoxal phosphate-dependent enzyme [Pseudomonas sp. B21-028]|jgi:aspartate/methionine/tyrosine aminotransferase|uniref:pyridoxal phosphate-dependent aminotransferase n=1 Tax=Pseudomonas sp. B21-028 TaxID=2895480 RepID=UPI0021607EC3|nr:pyridoxal phosphate-dependent aminotransferase [Pseudomonas sp. B21-028]UVL84916.1 aminotransferase class I/II-fold pyridoxal phosphate-dependent enzyme [Pseudomonas sp. B21-028]
MSVMTRLDDKEDITQHEISALKTRFNLADAHTHQDQSVTQREIVNRLPELWYRAQGQSQYQSEQEFIRAFFTFHGQEHALKRHDEIYLVYAASIAMHITATYLRKRNMSVGLIEPCFDNLHDLLKHMEVPLTPLDEALLQSSTDVYAKLQSAAAHVDAIFLVDPNNPTGTSMFAQGADTFVEVARYCKDHGKLLILDFCFAAFIKAAGGSRVDAYAILDDIGTQYIIMEDTGKTWPLQDTKCATIMSSQALNADIYSLVTSVLLNVSPFVLNVVTQYIRDSSDDDFESVRSVLDVNRAAARRHLQGNFLNYLTPMVETSVAWFEILREDVSADDLQAYLVGHEVYVLPGKYFYWSQPQVGQKYIRLALARKPAEFEQAVETIALALESYHG